MSEKIKIIAVVGPTASGKTALSIELAKRLGGEIISCDSMQIYKNMDVGTAKVTEEEAQGVPHHLVGFISPEDSFSCANYAALARDRIAEITGRGKIPIFCGGTGLYLDSVLTESEFSEAGGSEEIRERLSGISPDELYGELLRIDREAAEKTHKNNVKRVIRALEIYYCTGITKTEWDRRSREKESRYETVIIGLDFKNREALYDRINRRVDIMIDSGLISEVRALDSVGFRRSTASQGIGYKEILSYFDGEKSLSEAVEEIKKGSRNYAKRQLTWFKRNKSIHWIYRDLPQICGGADFDRTENGNSSKDEFQLIVKHALDIINSKL